MATNARSDLANVADRVRQRLVGVASRVRRPPSGEMSEVTLPHELMPDGLRRTLPLPNGADRNQLYSMLTSVSIDRAPEAEIAGYVGQDFERFVHTWGLVAGMTGRALEIGANPYFTTILLREFTDLDLTVTNFFGAGATGDTATQHLRYRRVDGMLAEIDIEHVVANVEQDPLPFADGSFEVVLFCEVIEHLISDPVAALTEVRRVLKPEGRLILSTPNVARLENVARLIAGANLYDPYSGHGVYGRHNREYTRHELHQVLKFCGFDRIESLTADVHQNNAESYCPVVALAPHLGHRLPDLGQYLFVTARRSGDEPRPGRPDFLYRSMPEGVLTIADQP